jgi:mannose-6-phosphate isomerase
VNHPALAFHLVPRPVTRPWGGRRIARHFGWEDDRPLGEWWLASCREDAPTALREGGANLSTWLDEHGLDAGCPTSGNFPLLVKFLDSQEVLSLQVHPNDAIARGHALPSGKTEAWHVLAAEPGAHVYHGTAPSVTCAELLSRVRAGAADTEIESMLRRVDVAPGDTLLVPAGTVHAIGPGVTLFEVQQNSDTTYRIHDWGRGRELQLDRASEALVDHPPETVRHVMPAADGWTRLLTEPAFGLRHARPTDDLALEPEGPFSLLTVLSGSGTLRAGNETAMLSPGDTLFVLGAVTVRGKGLELLAVDAPS